LRTIAARLLLALLLCALAPAACTTVEYPRAGRALDLPAGHSLLFGRITLSSHGQDLRPFSPLGAAPPAVGPELHLWLLRLGPRLVTPELAVDRDGAFWWMVEPGDYALVGNRHQLSSEEASDLDRQDMRVLALLRVPHGAVAYAGDLELTAAQVTLDAGLQTAYEFWSATVVDRHDEAAATLFERFPGSRVGALRSLMCAGGHIPSFQDADLFRRGRELLDRGCTN
jgi:hypothetical protein